MKNGFLAVSMAILFAFAMAGCATHGDLEKVQAQEMQNRAKADQAAMDAQAARATADAASLKATEASVRAENAEKRAAESAERERIANEKAQKADAVFQKSMRK
jgi:murein lipoprotein